MKRTKMEKAWRRVLFYGSLVVIATALLSALGCATIDCSRSDDAEFPVQEKWWK